MEVVVVVEEVKTTNLLTDCTSIYLVVDSVLSSSITDFYDTSTSDALEII